MAKRFNYQLAQWLATVLPTDAYGHVDKSRFKQLERVYPTLPSDRRVSREQQMLQADGPTDA